jgi:serine/threonine protein kinase
VLHGNKSTPRKGLALSQKARLKMAMDVACGMNYLHKQSPEPVLHRQVDILVNFDSLTSFSIIRDLKSSNLLVTEDLRIKVSDFGLARVKDSRYRPQHPLDIRIQAPEILAARVPSNMEYTEKSDIYSYG